MSRLLVELAEDEGGRAHAVLDACPTVELEAGVAAGPAELPEASFLVVEEGLVLLAGGEGGARRPMVIAIAAAGSVLVPPGRRQELGALTRARVAAVTREAERELLLEPAAAAALTSALVDAVCDREESIANFAPFPHAGDLLGAIQGRRGNIGRRPP